MALETVRVYAVDEALAALPGVLVRAYTVAGVLVTQNTTALVGGEAYCELALDGNDPPETYTIRLSMTGVAFDGTLGDDSKTPQTISVYSPPAAAPVTGTNNFQVQGQTFTLPTATDPRMCRCSGYFVDASGRPLENVDIHFVPVCYNEGQADFAPLIVDGLGVMGDKIITRTDEDGYLEIDLYRTAEISALVQGLEHSRRVIKVPDTASISLIDLLFPVVTSIAFAPDPVTVATGATVDVVLTILASDGQELDPTDQDVVFTSSDVGVASIQIQSDTGALRIMGVAAGATTIVAERADDTIVTIPEEPVTYAPLAVTVT